MSDAALRELLQLSPEAREAFRGVLVRDDAYRDETAQQLLRFRDRNGADWADILDLLTLNPDTRRQVVRLLGEIQATPQEH